MCCVVITYLIWEYHSSCLLPLSLFLLFYWGIQVGSELTWLLTGDMMLQCGWCCSPAVLQSYCQSPLIWLTVTGAATPTVLQVLNYFGHNSGNVTFAEFNCFEQLQQQLSQFLKKENKFKQAENGLQSRSGWHGLSWTIMDYHGLSWTIIDCHGLSWTILDWILYIDN